MISVDWKREERPILWAKATRAVEGAGWRDAHFSGLKSSFTNASFGGLKDSFGGNSGILVTETEGSLAAVATSRLGTWFMAVSVSLATHSTPKFFVTISAISGALLCDSVSRNSFCGRHFQKPLYFVQEYNIYFLDLMYEVETVMVYQNLAVSSSLIGCHSLCTCRVGCIAETGSTRLVHPTFHLFLTHIHKYPSFLLHTESTTPSWQFSHCHFPSQTPSGPRTTDAASKSCMQSSNRSA